MSPPLWEGFSAIIQQGGPVVGMEFVLVLLGSLAGIGHSPHCLGSTVSWGHC